MTEQTGKAQDFLQIKLFLGFLTAVVVFFIFQLLKDIFIPLFMALFLYFLLNGAVERLVKLKVPRAVVLICLLILIFVLFYFLGVLMFASVSSFIEKFPAYSKKMAETVSGLADKIKIPGVDLNAYIQRTDWSKGIDTSAVTSVLSSWFGSFSAFVGQVILVLLFLTFMLTGKGTLTGRFSGAFADDSSHRIQTLFDSIENQVRRYLVIKTSLCLITAVVSGVILAIGGFDFVLFSVLLIFILNFIPEVGSIIATLVPIVFGILEFGFSLRVLFVLVALMVFQFLLGNILEPKITGRGLNLSPIVILIALIFWSYIWGIVGAILAVPLTAALKIFLENMPTLNPLANLISE
ncbi:MAG: AI-2E family transporter [Candidatus Omnitrophota bacterium]